MDIQQRKSTAALISVASNSTLVVLKLVAGMAMGSVSVISEAIHSGVDLVAAIIALVAVRTSGKPSDDEHPYGHGKVENISGTIEALLIFVAGLWIIYESVQKLMHPHEIEALGWGVAVMFASAVANWLVSRVLFRVGNATQSLALLADGWHLRTDVYTSAGVMAGLVVIQLAGWLWPGAGLLWLDPVVAIAVACLIIHTAYGLTKQSARDLLDARLPREEEAWVRTNVLKFIPSVRGFHKLRTRKAGAIRFFEFHLFVDRDMSVEESHRISHLISNEIKAHWADANVTIHMEPCRGRCEGRCIKDCLLDTLQRQKIQKSNHHKAQRT